MITLNDNRVLLDWVDSHYHFVHDNIKIPDGEIIDRLIHWVSHRSRDIPHSG